jgi:hypothetical protein
VTKTKWRILGFLCLVLAAEVIYFTVIVPRTTLKRIFIEANFDVLESDIYELAQLQQGMLMMQVDVKQASALLLEQSMIVEAKLHRGHFGRLYVSLKGFSPSVALVTAQGGILLLDQDGYLFEGKRKTGLFPPLLHGAIFDSQEAEQLRLHPSMRPMLNTLNRLRESNYTLHSSIAGIKAVVHQERLAYWQINFIGQTTTAKLASYATPEDIQRAYTVLSALESEQRFLKEVDFRSNEIVYTKGR